MSLGTRSASEPDGRSAEDWYALTTTRRAPSSAASPAACRTARSAVTEPSVPTMMLRYPIPSLPSRCSDAVGAEPVLGVGQLARVLDEEARLADELTRALRDDPA